MQKPYLVGDSGFFLTLGVPTVLERENCLRFRSANCFMVELARATFCIYCDPSRSSMYLATVWLSSAIPEIFNALPVCDKPVNHMRSAGVRFATSSSICTVTEEESFSCLITLIRVSKIFLSSSSFFMSFNILVYCCLSC